MIEVECTVHCPKSVLINIYILTKKNYGYFNIYFKWLINIISNILQKSN